MPLPTKNLNIRMTTFSVWQIYLHKNYFGLWQKNHYDKNIFNIKILWQSLKKLIVYFMTNIKNNLKYLNPMTK